MQQLKIGVSSLRGVVGDALTPELIVNFACAMGTWCDGGEVVVGRDTRRSGSMLHAAVLSGLASAGCEVVDLGVAPTPLVSFAVRELSAAGGISITGSHNDARWNALKFLGPDGAPLNAIKTEELLDIYHASAYLLAPWEKLRKPRIDEGVLDRYLAELLKLVDVERIRARGFGVAVDFCNGACVDATTRFLEGLGCTVFPLNEEPGGDFARPPAPTSGNMRQLATLVRCLPADFGAAINIDGDRIGFVTAGGVPLSEEYTLPLAALALLAKRPGPVVATGSTSRMVDAIARELGQPVVRTMVGEGYVVDRALAEGAPIAGEGSGGVAFLPETTTYDAMLTLGAVLNQMAATETGLADLAQRLPKLDMRKGEIGAAPNVVYHVLDRFRERYADRSPDTTDGLRVEWDDAWLHVRASNTEPLLRIIVESGDAGQTDSLFSEAMTFARRMAFGIGQ